MLTYKQVQADDLISINSIYNILKSCGEDMYENQGLIHWTNPYPINSIQNNCESKEVYIVYCLDEPVGTFQLEYTDDFVTLSKFAVLPTKSGNGFGSEIIKHIAEETVKKQATKIKIDVYEKSIHAIKFYEKNGFTKTGTAQTRRFTIYLMEKNLL